MGFHGKMILRSECVAEAKRVTITSMNTKRLRQICWHYSKIIPIGST